MIAKISKSGSSFYGAALYNQKKIDQKQGKIIASQGLLGKKPKQLEKYFQQISKHSKVGKPVLHLALSFSEKDKPKLNDAQMTAISKDYLDKMGYGNQPYIIYRHDDTKHPHVHVLTTRVDVETYKKIDDSFEKKRSKQVLIGLEKQYDLVVAANQKTKRADSKEVQFKEGKGLVQDLQSALTNAPTSIAQLNKILDKNGSDFRAKSVGRGLVYHKVKPQNGDGKRTSQTWKSSDFKAEGLDKKGLEKQFEANHVDRKHIQSAVGKTLETNQEMTPTAFEKALEKYQIKPVYATNDKGIYGLSYQYKDKQFKASDLGKGHSWNQLKGQIVESKSNSLRENLSESIVRGESIDVLRQGRNTYFKSTNIDLQEQLNSLPKNQAKSLVRLHDDYQKRIYRDPLMNDRALIKDLVGDDIDAYLQRQHQIKQQQSKRNINQSTRSKGREIKR